MNDLQEFYEKEFNKNNSLKPFSSLTDTEKRNLENMISFSAFKLNKAVKDFKKSISEFIKSVQSFD